MEDESSNQEKSERDIAHVQLTRTVGTHPADVTYVQD